MNRIAKHAEIAHDLIFIHYSRTAAYEKALRFPEPGEETNRLLRRIVMQGRNFLLQLRKQIDISYGDPADRVEIRGEVVNGWPGLRPLLPESSYYDIIHTLEYNEWTTVLAYQKALMAEENYCNEFKKLVADQLRTIRQSFDQLHGCRQKPAMPDEQNKDGYPFIFSRGETMYVEEVGY
jgi:hypothetical protein